MKEPHDALYRLLYNYGWNGAIVPAIKSPGVLGLDSGMQLRIQMFAGKKPA